MALINCPECGRENVSDSAESCPNCGYGIKAHFEKIKENEIQQNRLKTVSMPQKPKEVKFDISLWIIIIACSIFPPMFHMFSLLDSKNSEYEFEIGKLVFLFFCGLCCGILLSVIIYHDKKKKYNIALKKYYLAMSNLEQYKKDKIREQDERVGNIKNQVHCPYCNSTKILRITGTERAVSLIGLGIFSKKINKSFKCRNCGGTF